MTSNLDILHQVAAQKGANPVMLNFLEHAMCVESSGKANAKCTTSSAYGLFQMLDGTWAGMVRSHPGELSMGGRSDPHQQVLAAYYYAQDNAAALQKNGHQVTEANLYLCNFLGAGGANTVLNAPAGTRLKDIVSPGVINSNRSIRLDYDDKSGVHHSKSFADFTSGDLQAWTTKKMGGKINYSMLDRDVQGEVVPWQGDNENPLNNFRALGDMSFGEILGTLLMAFLSSAFNASANVQHDTNVVSSQSSPPTLPRKTPSPATARG